jgi:hypothetical protein
MTPVEITLQLNSGANKIWFQGEKKSYKIMAFDNRYIICQKPFNPRRTFQYSIVDLEREIRGADNYRCKFEYDDPKECQEALKELHSGDLEISYRNRVDLEVIKMG